MPFERFLFGRGNGHRDLRHVGCGVVADDVVDQGNLARWTGGCQAVLAHIAEQLLVAWGCLPMCAAKANGQAACGGSLLDAAHVSSVSSSSIKTSS